MLICNAAKLKNESSQLKKGVTFVKAGQVLQVKSIFYGKHDQRDI